MTNIIYRGALASSASERRDLAQTAEKYSWASRFEHVAFGLKNRSNLEV